MMRVRTVVTASSVWKFDLDLMRYLRFPRHEAPNDTGIPYTGEWDDFIRIETCGDRLIVHRPVPFGTGALRMTGQVITDTRPGPWPRELLEPELDDQAQRRTPVVATGLDEQLHLEVEHVDEKEVRRG